MTEHIEGLYYSSKKATKDWVIDVITKPIASSKAFMETLNSDLAKENGLEVLWCIHELQWPLIPKPVRWIGSYRIYHLIDKGWGFTKAAETTPPKDYSCPLSYLGLVDPVNNGWRDRVYKYHTEKMCKELMK